VLQRESRDAVVRRLQFAQAELEVSSGIAVSEGERVLVEQLHTLAEGVRECIATVLNGGQNT